MKKVLKVLAILLVIVAIVCGAYFIALQATKKESMKTVDELFLALKSGDEEKIKEYITLEDNETSTDDTINTSEMEKVMLKNLSYEVVSTDVKLNECKVKLNVSNKDLKTVFGNYMKKALSLAFSQAFSQFSEEEMTTQLEKYFVEQYDSEDIEMVKNELNVTVKRENGKWKITYDKDEMKNALVPGYKEIMESFNSMV